MKQGEFRGRALVAFEHITEAFPPNQFGLFVAVSYVKLNALRAEKVATARAMGYRLASYLSSRATVFPGFELKENCFILEDNTNSAFCPSRKQCHAVERKPHWAPLNHRR